MKRIKEMKKAYPRVGRGSNETKKVSIIIIRARRERDSDCGRFGGVEVLVNRHYSNAE